MNSRIKKLIIFIKSSKLVNCEFACTKNSYFLTAFLAFIKGNYWRNFCSDNHRKLWKIIFDVFLIVNYNWFDL